jgi:hypothetical protein
MLQHWPVGPTGVTIMIKRFLAGGVLFFIGLALVAGWFVTRPGPGQLSTQLFHKKTLMTIAYKAYGNPEAAMGKYWLSKMVLQNTGKSSLKGIKVSYQIPDYVPWTTADEDKPELLPGQTSVFMYYPKLPRNVTEIRTKTPATLEVKIEYTDAGGPHSSIEKRDFEFRGITEIEYTSLAQDDIVTWYDMFDNNELLAAFVHDEDPVVKAYFTKVSEVSGGMDVISGRKELEQLGKSVYDFMCSTGMTYSGAKGVPEKLGDVNSTVQSIRLPRDVISGNSGLCVELALTWASIGEAAGAKAYVVLLPHHAFTILAANDGSEMPVECTDVGGGSGGNLKPAKSFEDAQSDATGEFDELVKKGIPFDVIDIEKLQSEGIRAPELPDKDLAALRTQLDEMRAHHAGNGGGGGGNVVVVNNNGGGGNDGGAAAGMATWQDPNNQIQVSYPQNWTQDPNVVANIQKALPGYMFYTSDAATRTGMEVINYPNAESEQAALRQLNTLARQLGIVPIYGPPRNSQLGVHPCISYTVGYKGPYGPVVGEVSFIRIGNSIYSVGMSSPAGLAANAAATFVQIKASIKTAGSN